MTSFLLENIHHPDIDKRTLPLPDYLQRQLIHVNFEVGRINVRGDGYCGYYVIQLVDWALNGRMLSVRDLNSLRKELIMRYSNNHALFNAPNHYLEYIELGSILEVLISANVGLVTQTGATYPIHVINYQPGRDWVFILLSNNKHYELLTVKNEGYHRVLFSLEESRAMFEVCKSEYPTKCTYARDQLGYIEVGDIITIHKDL